VALRRSGALRRAHRSNLLQRVVTTAVFPLALSAFGLVFWATYSPGASYWRALLDALAGVAAMVAMVSLVRAAWPLPSHRRWLMARRGGHADFAIRGHLGIVGNDDWRGEVTFERMTDQARRAFFLAEEEARLLNHTFIGSEHVLLGLLHEGEGLAGKALESLGVSLQAAREKVEETIGPVGTAPPGSRPLTPRAKSVLQRSLREALQLGQDRVGTEHMLLAIVREGESLAAQVLVSLGLDLSRVRQQVIQLLSGYQGKDPAEDADGPVRGGPFVVRPDPRVSQVGDDWRAEVVRAGREPSVYASAYDALAGLVRRFGIDLDTLPADRVTVASVETNEGPGLRFVVQRGPGEPSTAGPSDLPSA
jgi:hypothetical protein